MITVVEVGYFKRFETQRFELADHIVLAGPDNSGKTTLLQAIMVWDLALRRWRERRSGSTASERTGVPLTRKDFTALPLREMNLLWTDTLTALRKEDVDPDQPDQLPGRPRVLTISLTGRTRDGPWDLTFEFRYQNTEVIYVKPSAAQIGNIPQAAEDLNVVHVPAFSGIGAEETRYDRPFQDLLIGQGKAGDILRNLLLEVHQQQDKANWTELCRQIEEIFGYRLLPPEYEGRPFILCEYLGGVPKGRGKNKLAQLDIASAGSGFHQVLLLLGFFYARPASVLLLDEPDAHSHVILQKQVYDWLRRVAGERGCQLVIATHSEVLIDDTSPEMILSFFRGPHRLVADVEREQVTQALRRLSAMDMLRAEASGGILYVEGEDDFNALSTWARVLEHPLHKWFAGLPFWHSNQGRHPREARAHFFALRALHPNMRAVLLLDGDNRQLPDREVEADGLEVLRWRRYEAESYLIHPAALSRFVAPRALPFFASQAQEFLRGRLPPDVYRDPLLTEDFLERTPVSKTLLPEFFRKADVSLSKKEYYLIATQMRKDEIAEEVTEKLDAIQAAFGL